MILSKKRTTKTLISLRGCAGWSAPLLFANPGRQASSRRGPFDSELSLSISTTYSMWSVFYPVSINTKCCIFKVSYHNVNGLCYLSSTFIYLFFKFTWYHLSKAICLHKNHTIRANSKEPGRFSERIMALKDKK